MENQKRPIISESFVLITWEVKGGSEI